MSCPCREPDHRSSFVQPRSLVAIPITLTRLSDVQQHTPTGRVGTRWVAPLNSVTQDRQCTYNVTLGCFRLTTVDVENQYVLGTYSECVSVVLVIQHAERMHRIILSSVACLAVPYFSTYFINGTIFGGKNH
jgi:hypothetical protein